MSQPSRNHSRARTLVRATVLFFYIGFCSFSSIVLADNNPVSTEGDKSAYSKNFSMRLHNDARAKVGDEEYDRIANFFHLAERAIEDEDIDALMSLYSDSYTHINNQGREFARGVWLKIFSNFDSIAARHSMRLITHQQSENSYVVVTECSGLLSGIPKGEERAVTIDSWDRQRHILINEGTWKLFGNAGVGKKRYGEDKFESHPLF